MKFQKEFNYCFVVAVLIVLLYAVFAITLNLMFQIMLSVVSIIVGSSLVVLGFWGADFAFALASGQLHQEKIRGEFKGKKKEVYVPFMKNYTPLEWWNLNWFITFLGVFLLSLGTLILGIAIGVYLF
jgi:hypothetical protein